jgi:hypothetical protein
MGIKSLNPYINFNGTAILAARVKRLRSSRVRHLEWSVESR